MKTLQEPTQVPEKEKTTAGTQRDSGAAVNGGPGIRRAKGPISPKKSALGLSMGDESVKKRMGRTKLGLLRKRNELKPWNPKSAVAEVRAES